jgi:hypothetical protein
MAAAKARRENFSIIFVSLSERSRQIAGDGPPPVPRIRRAANPKCLKTLCYLKELRPAVNRKIDPAKASSQEDDFPKQAKLSMNVLTPHIDP